MSDMLALAAALDNHANALREVATRAALRLSYSSDIIPGSRRVTVSLKRVG